MICGRLIKLREPVDGDLPRLTTWRNDLVLQSALMAAARPNTPERVKEWLSKRLAESDTAFFIIAELHTDEALGFIQALSIDTLHGTAELGICLAVEAQGKGLAAEALGLLENYLYARFNLRKLMLKVLADNRRAIAFYEKQEFVRVGVWQQHFYSEGQYRDVLLMEKFLQRGAAAA